MRRGRFVVIDGLGRSGKSTTIRYLMEKLPKESTVFTREPGGTPLAERIREMLLFDEVKLSPLSHMLLFFAARRAHIEDKILPALNLGHNVICDRFDSSTDAYNLWGEDAHHLRLLFNSLRENVVTPDIRPFYVILDVDARVAYERNLATRKETERDKFDEQELAFYERVRKGYLQFSTQHRSVLVDANCSLEELQEKVFQIVDKVLA